jgi:uncharacterized protein DUF5658
MERIVGRIHDGRLFLYVVTVLVMSGYDAMATMQHIGRGVAAEGNPIMRSLIDANAVEFFSVKMGLTASCLILCYTFSHLRAARVGIQLALAAYSLLCLYHMAIFIFV